MLAGGDLPLPLLGAWCASATRIYAADGGADRVLAAGHRPHVVVGDLDSLSARPGTEGEALAGIEVVPSDDQDTTDAEKLLALVAARGHGSVTLVSLEGDRLDHLLGTLSAAAASPLTLALGLRTTHARLVQGPGRWCGEAPPGARVSVLPLGVAEGVTLAGVRWPVEGRAMALGGFVSVSNEALGGPLSLSLDAGAVLVLVGTDARPRW